MTYLLSISIGPVQPFIEASRRTADLTAGSELLVEIAKAIARSIASTPNSRLIFPADPDKDGPNKILAEVSGSPEDIAEAAREAAQEVLKGAWEVALREVGSDDIQTDLADRQIESFLEFYAAWVPVNGDYAAARIEVERLLAGRKALRDFGQPISNAGIPKSPLDPSRDSVIQHPTAFNKPPLYLKPSEHLDAVSVVKRIRGRTTGGVPSTSELAASALIEAIGKDPQRAAHLASLRTLAQKAGSGVGVADLLYPARRQDAVKSGELSESDAAAAANEAEKALGSAAPPDWASYYAILCADGDHMGRMLGEKTSPADHIVFSQKLSGFAEAAKTTVAKHGGHCVYSGGDDVLALLPAHTALQCAADLAADFHADVDGTLSVGVAIVHHMEPLRVSLDCARGAEREAKNKRDSLAVALHTRGGEPRIVAEKWLANHDLTVWKEWTDAFRHDSLSHGFPYELRSLAREVVPAFAGSSKIEDVIDADTLKAEAQRILDRKKGASGGAAPPASLKEAIDGVGSSKDLEDLVAKLIICRFLAQYPEVQ